MAETKPRPANSAALGGALEEIRAELGRALATMDHAIEAFGARLDNLETIMLRIADPHDPAWRSTYEFGNVREAVGIPGIIRDTLGRR